MNNIKNFDLKLVKLDKRSSMDISIYYIGYVMKKPEYNIDSVNSLHLVFNDVDAYFESIDANKYLVFALTNKNREALESYKQLWSEIKE